MSSRISNRPSEKEENRPQVRFLTITEKNEAQRIDNFLLSVLKGVPKSKIYRVIRKGEVRINKKRCKPETKLQLDDIVRIPPVFGKEDSPKETKLSDSFVRMLDGAILYEDKEVLVINKPSGLAVHGGSGIRLGLIEALRTRYPENQFLELVHRLDRDTSGCILVAKSRKALRDLHEQFRDDKINKIYHLMAYGKWPAHKKVVDAPLKKNELKSGERMVMVHQEGKRSRTEFRVLAKVDQFTLLEAKPITGRTHQIRVHAAFSGHAIVGDDKYQDKDLALNRGLEKARLMLHARRIEFRLPGGKKLGIEAEYDRVFAELLKQKGLIE